MSEHSPRTDGSPARWLVLIGGPLVLAGLFGFGFGAGSRGAWSFLAGFLIALAVVTGGVLMVDVAGRLTPAIVMLVAVLNYVMTTLIFLLLLTLISPELADVPAFACGLAGAVAPYVAWQVARVRPGQ